MPRLDKGAYDSEVHFSVGQRVLVSIPEIPDEETNCKEGLITSIHTRFARTPELRQVTYKVRFDRAVIKDEFVYIQQIMELNVHADRLTLLGRD